MAKNVNHVSHIKSTSSAITSGNSVFIADGKAGPKLPVASTLIQGEIAVNLAKDVETLSIVNTSGEIVTFSSDKIIKKVIVDNEQVTSAALNDLEERKQNKLTAGDGITIDNDNVISATASISPVDLPISGGSATDYSQNDVPSAGSVLDRFLADEGRMSEIEVVTSAALNDLNSRVSTVSGDVETLKTSVANKVDNSTYAAYTANTQTILDGKQDALTAGPNITINDNNVISATDTTYTAGEGISISSSNVISNTAITIVDDELNSGSPNPVANSVVTEAISALTVEVRNNELVDAAALNDLNARKLDASAITGYATEEWVTNQGYLTEHQSLSGYATTAVTNQLRNDVNTLSGNSITGASYNSTTKKIEFTTSTGKTIEVDATAFIKDGMVDKVAVSGVASGGSTVECLVVTFNTDAGKENINIPLYRIFDSNQYYTKTEIDDKLGSGFTGSNSGVTVTQAINDSEKVVASALNDLNNRKLDASAYTEPDLSAYATEEWVSDRLGSGFTGDSIGTVTDAFNFAFEEIGKKADTTWVEEKLGSGFTGDNSGNTVTKVIEENELVVAAALNDLETKKLDASAYTPTDLSDYATEEWVNDRLGSGFTGSSVTEVFNNTEEVIAEALADLDERISGNTTYITQVNAKADTIARSLSGYTPTGYSYSKGEVEAKLNNKLDASAYTQTSIVELDNSTEYASGDVPTALSVRQIIVNNELVVASALNDLEERKLDESAFTETAAALETLSGEVASAVENLSTSIDAKQDKLTAGSGITIDSTNTISVKINADSDEWFSGSTGVPATSALAEVLEEIEEVTATALNDLNDRLLEVSGSQLTASSFKTINGQTIVGSGNISIEGSGGGQDNVIETVKVNGTALTPDSNKAVNITSVPGSIVTQDATHRFVSDTEKTTWNNKQNAFSNANTLSGISATNVTNWNSVTAKTDTTAFTAHTGDTTVHVTAAEKSTWNGKQDALPNASVLTGISSTNVTNWNNAATSAHSHSNKTVLDNLTQTVIDNSHTHDNKTVLDGITTAKTASWDTVTAKTDNTAFTAHTANTTAHVTSTEKSTWSGKQDALSNASVLTGITSQKVTNWDGAATNSHTHNNKTVLDGVTSAKVTQWDNAISGVSFNGTTATVSNHVASITATIPAAPGTLTTTATTAQSTATNEALSGNIALHKVSKTGSYNDLNDKPTITNNYVTGGRVDTSDGTIKLSRSGLGEVSITGMDDYVNGVVDDKVSKTGDTMTGALTISADTANTLNVIGGSTTGDTKPVLNVGTTYHPTILKIFDDGTTHAQINGTLEVSTSDGAAIKSTVNSSGHTGFTTNGMVIASAFQVSGHTNQYLNELLLANGRILVLPTFSSADNGKILGIQNGQLAWIKPTTIYTGTGTPSSSQGNNGDIYLQTS